jgi:hypothetical protein
LEDWHILFGAELALENEFDLGAAAVEKVK